MPKFEQFDQRKQDENALYQLREEFVKENYPAEESSHEMEDLLGSGLDGREVLEKRDKEGELEAILTYAINQDHEKTPYLSIGIMLTREESRGEGAMGELFSKAKQLAEKNGCEYITAIADTEEGEKFLPANGFGWERDPVNDREHLRLEL